MPKQLWKVQAFPEMPDFRKIATSATKPMGKEKLANDPSSILGSSHVKGAHKLLMKLTLVVNFINILPVAFTQEDPEN